MYPNLFRRGGTGQQRNVNTRATALPAFRQPSTNPRLFPAVSPRPLVARAPSQPSAPRGQAFGSRGQDAAAIPRYEGAGVAPLSGALSEPGFGVRGQSYAYADRGGTGAEPLSPYALQPLQRRGGFLGYPPRPSGGYPPIGLPAFQSGGFDPFRLIHRQVTGGYYAAY